MQKQSEYYTKDIGEAAALICVSTQLLRLEKESNFFWFVFSNKDKCQKLSKQYWFSELLINAKSYQEALRTLKSKLFSQK